MPQTSQTASSTASQTRLHGFDALRAMAAVLVIMLHAGTPYAFHPMPGLVWPTHDAAPSPVVDAVFWWIECFVMPLFFVISGFFAAQLLGKLGPGDFVRHRTKRLLLPLLAGVLVILPFEIYIWALGWVVDGKFPFKSMLTLKFNEQIDANLWGTSHLWFLQYLFLYCAVLSAVQGTRLGKRIAHASSSSSAARLLQSTWKPLVLAIPCALVIWWAPRVILGFQHSFLPVLSKFIYNAIFFGVGVWMHQHRAMFADAVGDYRLYLALSPVVFAVALPLFHQHLDQELAGMPRLALASLIGLVIWVTVLGLIGVFYHHVRSANPPAVQYVAEASFWIYLIHHPTVGLVQVTLSPLAIPALAKFCVVTLTALGFSLLTYDAFVRYTWLGLFLNGTRRQRVPALMPRIFRPEVQPASASEAEEPVRRREAA